MTKCASKKRKGQKMAKVLILADAHSTYAQNKIELQVQGGSPYFTYVWLDDILYVLEKTSKVWKLKRRNYRLNSI